MLLSDFDFDLPEELIAQEPLAERTGSRLMVLDRVKGDLTIGGFNDIVDYFRSGDVLVMVGTKKGTFLFWSDPDRRAWQRSGHHLGWSTHAISYDPRQDSIYAATNSAVFGALVQRSDNGGQTWEHRNHGLDFPDTVERRVREVWQVQPGNADRPGEVWAGSRQAGQIFLTRRCARAVHRDEETRKGSTPMLIRRVTAPRASFVCSVDRTRWPVRDA